ncbi:hypothetical protein Zmor_020619 [Zophobas morio]|uniref:Uncharacterized protein n=1 Tax=Zophobas morio TaxID=2755281 RepID=A0AA38M9T4_9CUCU|nr:hypothetical protein Zmor_020619 [Zophobas morio]
MYGDDDSSSMTRPDGVRYRKASKRTSRLVFQKDPDRRTSGRNSTINVLKIMDKYVCISFILLIFWVQFTIQEEYDIPDSINIDDILKNDRLTMNYIKCMLDQGKCTPEGDKLRNHNEKLAFSFLQSVKRRKNIKLDYTRKGMTLQKGQRH